MDEDIHSHQVPSFSIRAPRLPRTAERRTGSGAAVVELVDRIKQGAGERRSFRDRRASARICVGLIFEVETAQQPLRFVTADLSTFGLSVSQGRTPKIGTRWNMKLFLPEEPQNPIPLVGEVLGARGNEGGFRLKFLSPHLEVLRRLHRFVK